jgi:hypothetical protein
VTPVAALSLPGLCVLLPRPRQRYQRHPGWTGQQHYGAVQGWPRAYVYDPRPIACGCVCVLLGVEGLRLVHGKSCISPSDDRCVALSSTNPRAHFCGSLTHPPSPTCVVPSISHRDSLPVPHPPAHAHSHPQCPSYTCTSDVGPSVQGSTECLTVTDGYCSRWNAFKDVTEDAVTLYQVHDQTLVPHAVTRPTRCGVPCRMLRSLAVSWCSHYVAALPTAPPPQTPASCHAAHFPFAATPSSVFFSSLPPLCVPLLLSSPACPVLVTHTPTLVHTRSHMHPMHIAHTPHSTLRNPHPNARTHCHTHTPTVRLLHPRLQPRLLRHVVL